MLPLAELVRFGALLDADWHCAVGDAAAERWGADPPVFLRSSAAHVLVARRPDGPRLVLRLRPDVGSAAAVLGRGAAVASAWHAAGAPVAPAVASLPGRLLEQVDGYVVTALEAVEGDPLADDLTLAQARSWGETVARAHAVGAGVTVPVPTTGSFLQPDADGVPPGLAHVARGLRAQLAALPREAAVHGLLHGDPEPDNVVVGPAGPVLVDPDEVRRGWFASDVGFALRAWAPADDPVGVADLAAAVPAAFVDGYRTVRPLTDAEVDQLPLHARVAAWEDWHGLQGHVRAAADPGWPEWAVHLDARVRSRAAALAAALLE